MKRSPKFADVVLGCPLMDLRGRDLLAVLAEEVAGALRALAAKVVAVLHLGAALVARQAEATPPAEKRRIISLEWGSYHNMAKHKDGVSSINIHQSNMFLALGIGFHWN